jgi:hypothetical protein
MLLFLSGLWLRHISVDKFEADYYSMAFGNEYFENELNGCSSDRMAVPWSRRLVPGILQRRRVVGPTSAHVVFVMDKVELGQAFPLPVSFCTCSFHIRVSVSDDM